MRWCYEFMHRLWFYNLYGLEISLASFCAQNLRYFEFFSICRVCPESFPSRRVNSQSSLCWVRVVQNWSRSFYRFRYPFGPCTQFETHLLAHLSRLADSRQSWGWSLVYFSKSQINVHGMVILGIFHFQGHILAPIWILYPDPRFDHRALLFVQQVYFMGGH